MIPQTTSSVPFRVQSLNHLMFSSNSSAPQPWQQEEASDRGRFPPIESAAYQPSLDQQPHYHPPRGEQPPDNFTSREDTRREDNRYSSREHGYTRYPSREEVAFNPSPLTPLTPLPPYPPLLPLCHYLYLIHQ